MKQKLNRHSLTAVLFLMGLLFFAGLANVNAQTNATIYGVMTNNQLVRFNSLTPSAVTNIGSIAGLQNGEFIVGIDIRPATGQLYGLGSTSRLYVIDKTTAFATSVGVLSTALSGTEFGFDFNPTVDRIRIVSNTGQNLRVNPADASAIVDGAINGAATQPTAAAYTNNFAGATTTTLYDIDATTDNLYIQNPANSGTLALVGALGVDFQNVNGFDFFSGNNTAYAATVDITGSTQLYTINLTTGAATSVGIIGGAVLINPLRGIAVDTGAPATAGFGIIALTTTNQLIRFNSNRANTPIGNAVTITGLQTGESILGIDIRPATGQLYGLGSSNRLYVINPATGVATVVGAAGAFTLSGTNFGFDFNPTVDRIRVISDTGQNLRLNPIDGTLTATDPNLNGAATGADAAAYTNSFGGATTTLYDISSTTDFLYQQNPANAGTLIGIGTLGFDITGNNGFDIANSGNVALAALQPNGSATSNLYTINLTTGAATFISPINASAPIRGLVISSGSTATNLLDFDGDGRADYAVYRSSNNTIYIRNSSTGNFFGFPFGDNSTDIFTPGDYDGDGRTDVAVFRTTTGTFFVLRSSTNTVQGVNFGQAGDEPVARDYTGDGRTDYAVVRRANAAMTWYIQDSTATPGTFTSTQFGLSSDVTAPGDYDGDGRFDLAVFRGASNQPATFYVQRSSGGFTGVQFGQGSDLVVPGDYDGDGKTDYALLRTGSAYNWYVLRSSDNGFFGVQFGAKPQLSVQNDYDGDGRTDIAVWDPLSGTFFVSRSTGGLTQVRFGQNGDYPIANYDTH